MILDCTCKHEGQDRLHGAHKRVHNPTSKDGRVNGWRCTVCAAEKNMNGQEVQAAKRK